MKEESDDKISVPVALHWDSVKSGSNLFLQLSNELITERQRNFMLTNALIHEKQKSQSLESCLSSLMGSCKSGFPRVDSSSSIASTAADQTEEKPTVGIYSPAVRKDKILRYKEKVRKYRQKIHVSRVFGGRSSVAKTKLRIKGKFVKICD